MINIEKLYRKYVSIDEKKHIIFIIDCQDKGGWGEEIKDVGKNVLSPLVTAQMVIGLLPYLKISTLNELTEKIKRSVKDGLQFIINEFKNSGWSDHSGDYIIVDATGAAVTAIIKSLSHNIVVPKSQEYIFKAIEFLLDQQNGADGGWSVSKKGDSKIQYTYWALKALHSCSKFELGLNGLDITSNIDRGCDWLKKNFEAHNKKGFSVTMQGGIGAVATSFGVELFDDFSIDYDKQKVIKNFEESQSDKGSWEIQTDATTVGDIPRRVYVLNDLPRILECLAFLGVRFDSNLFKDVLQRVRNLEIKCGGFKHQKSDQYPIGWFSAETIKMLSTLIIKFNDEYEKYEKSEKVVRVRKKHSFSKGVLMIGRFRPPHMGHYYGLRAILYGDKNEFSLPAEVLKELIDIDKIFLGITRYEIDKENPLTVGEVREIWRQIIDNDKDLKIKSNIIEIVTCPADRNLTNVVNAIDELTYNRNLIIVVSGNDRIIEQCDKNNVKKFLFKRSDRGPSGSQIREIISKINFDNLYESKKLLDDMKNMLHPAAFEVMLRDGLFKRAQKNINAR